MFPANFRSAFIETLQELTEFACEEPGEEQVEWTADYLSRSQTWYHFEGVHDCGRAESSGLSFDTRSGAASPVDSAMLPLALLDFHENAAVAAYFGNQGLSTQIASQFLRGFAHVPEIVRVSIEREQKLECGTLRKTSTAFVFVGFECLDDVDDIGSGKGLATSADEISRYWFRSRTRILRPVPPLPSEGLDGPAHTSAALPAPPPTRRHY